MIAGGHHRIDDGFVRNVSFDQRFPIALGFLHTFEESADCALLSSFCDDSNLHIICIHVCTLQVERLK